MAAKPIQTDVLVVGAGLVGMTAALAMHDCGYEVLLLDRHAAPKRFKPKQYQDWDQRIYAISPNNAQWLQQLGVWSRLDATRLTPMAGMHIWGEPDDSPLILDAQSVPVENLGTILESSALIDACYQQLKTTDIKTLFNRECVSIDSQPSGSRVTVRAKTNTQEIEAKLVIAADGAQSWVRNQLNFPYQSKAYAQTAIVANFKVEQAHQAIARQWFRQVGDLDVDILAWLPMPDQTISMVWSLPDQQASDYMAMTEDALTQSVQLAGQQALGAMQLISKPACFALSLSSVLKPMHNSTLLFGDAAHRIHPLAGQGVNLGFRDVQQWQTLIAHKTPYQSVNDAQLLKQFVRQRKADVFETVSLTDGLYHLFNSQHGLVKTVRQWGLNTTKQYETVKRLLVQHAVHQ